MSLQAIPRLRVVRDALEPDVETATGAARAFLTALGADTTADGMAETPARMARAYADLFTAAPFSAMTFPK